MLIFYLVGILIVCAICVPWYAKIKKNKSSLQTVIVKTVPTFSMMVFAAVTTFRFFPYDVYALWVSAGLFFGMLGDAFLINHFLVGGIFFGLGHVCYCAAFLTIGRPNIATLLLVLLLLVMLFFLRKKISQWVKGRPYMLGCGIVYALLLVFMLTTGCSMPFAAPSLRTWLGAIGGLMFVASDAFLMINAVTKASDFRWSCSLSVYYAAQLLIALSVAVSAFMK